MSHAVGWMLLAVALMLSRPAEAAKEQKARVAVLRPEGRPGDALRKVLTQELGKKGRGRVVLPARTVDAQVKRIRGAPKTDDQRQALAAKLKADALITASVKGTKSWDVEVRVYSGEDGSLLAEERWSGLRTNRAFPEVKRELESRLAAALREAREPRPPSPPVAITPPAPMARPEPEPTPPAPVVAEAPRPAVVETPAPAPVVKQEPVKEEPVQPVVAKEASARRPNEPRLEVLLSGQGLFRRFQYSGASSGSLPDYRLNHAAAVSLAVGYYPLSHFTDGALRNLGLVVRGSRALGLSSLDPEGRKYSTTAQLVEGGLRFRLPLRWLELTPGVLYGMHTFEVGFTPEAGMDDLPDVDYRFAHVELGLRKELTERWAVAARVGYQHVLSGGELSSDRFFPDLGGSGLDAELAVEFALTRMVGLRVGGEMRRYSITTNAKAGSPVIAGGAMDQYFSGLAGLTLRP
ncbi:hypothetical protein JY651_27815 [Pyxidicoccus parkwayensis]|uniref:Outer membrane protein beta-barrel domain-containing protein n=1 Tax=Pyxidicoccus parkwayensis TaxID=2813578 RepID=A0ABX7PE31_9BACT|nr:hypothetical protein [Pyxidicoccus parkwaysis]QSQ28618.1 hypothetical protein JY651_27815 [Pyxidicoccus parkwaysis]